MTGRAHRAHAGAPLFLVASSRLPVLALSSPFPSSSPSSPYTYVNLFTWETGGENCRLHQAHSRLGVALQDRRLRRRDRRDRAQVRHGRLRRLRRRSRAPDQREGGRRRDGRLRRRPGQRPGVAAQGDEHGRRPRRASQGRQRAPTASPSRARSPPSSRPAATIWCCSASTRSTAPPASSARPPPSCSAFPA